MSIVDKLASSLGRRDEEPNKKLAAAIAAKKDKKSVKELVDLLQDKNKNIQGDCIKVLDEVGERSPTLVSDYANVFVSLLDDKNNRLQWGAMCVLDHITLENPKVIYGALGKIISSAEKGTVITKDHAVNILVKLCSQKQYVSKAFPLLVEQILLSPPNQLPTYAEKAMPFVNEQNKKLFLKAITSRLKDIDTDTKKKRLEKVIQKVS